MVTDYIREYVKEECNKSFKAKELYENHILVVADYAVRLGRLLGADSLIVELSSYLHDFSTHHNFEHKNNHTLEGSKKIQELLRQFKFSEDVIERVSDTILANSRPYNNKNLSKEAICLFNAEAMSLIAKPVFWIYYSNLLNEKKRTYKDNVRVYLEWVDENWKHMIDAARDMMSEEYASLKELSNR